MLPRVPPSEPWLASAKAHFGADENHPNVIRILEILRKKEAGDITIEEHKEFLILNDELTEAHEAIHGKGLYPSGEIISYPKAHTREEIAATVDWMFDADKNEAEATCARIAALEQQVLQHVQKQGIGWPPRWIQLAQSVGMDESHPALRNLLEGLEKIPGKITWKEWQAEMNDLLGVMEKAWKKKNSHSVRRMPPKGSGVRAPRTLKGSGRPSISLKLYPISALYAAVWFGSMMIFRSERAWPTVSRMIRFARLL